MASALDRLKESASQTAGPYVHIGLTPELLRHLAASIPSDLGATMVNAKTRGERISVCLRVFDGAGMPIRDALVEIWQADAAGLYNSPAETRGTADPNFLGLGPQGDRHGNRRMPVRNDQAGPRAVSRTAA